jgi:hypothetical protein
MWVQINRDGMRDRDHTLAAAPRTVRVAVLGDSYMQGLNVPVEQTFAAWLESRLQRCLAAGGKTAEVLNFGVSGYGTAQELLTYRHHAAQYRPDIVLLAVYTNNDIYNNHRRLNPTDHPEQSPYFTLRDGVLTLDDTFRSVLAAKARQPWWRRWRMFVTSHLRTAQLAYEAWGAIRPRLIAAAEQPSDPVIDLEAAGESIYRPPETIEAWQVTEALIAQLARDVRDAGAEPWMVTLANGPQIEIDPLERQAFFAEQRATSPFYPDERLAALAHAEGIPSVSLAQPMSDIAITERVPMRGGYSREFPLGSGHWNETGNRIAAELTGDQLCARSAAIVHRTANDQ